MLLTDDEIRALSPEALNKLLAEMMGLEWVQPTPLSLQDAMRRPQTKWAIKHGVLPYLPNFVGGFNALTATKERIGFDGPVAWLRLHMPSPGEDVWDLKHHEWTGVWSFLNKNIAEWTLFGPRNLAEECAIAGQSVKEKG